MWKCKRVVDVLKAYGLLYSRGSSPIKSPSRKLTFDEINFASELEARISEVLPALVRRYPSVIADPENMPESLKAILEEIRNTGKASRPFRGISPDNYMTWVNEFKKPNSKDRQIRVNFRFSHEDRERMERLQKNFS